MAFLIKMQCHDLLKAENILERERNEYVVKSISVSGQKYLFSSVVDNIVTSFLWQWCMAPDKVFTKIKTHKRSYEHNKYVLYRMSAKIIEKLMSAKITGKVPV